MDPFHINRPLYRAYLLKEQLREIFRLPSRAGVSMLELRLARAGGLFGERSEPPGDARADGRLDHRVEVDVLDPLERLPRQP